MGKISVLIFSRQQFFDLKMRQLNGELWACTYFFNWRMNCYRQGTTLQIKESPNLKRLSIFPVLIVVLCTSAAQAQSACDITAASDCTVSVNSSAAASETPVISSFSATPATIALGQSTSLAWNVSGETSLTITDGNQSASILGAASPFQITPTVTTIYTLTAGNGPRSTSKSVKITVNQISSPGTSSGQAGGALTACGDITKSGTYYLANDVSSTVGCFAIDAANVKLNLNGHTITYDTGGSSYAPAIQAHDCWSSNPVIAGECGKDHSGFEVYGGTIVQAVSSSTFSPVFEFGESQSISPAPYIHDITAKFQDQGAQFYYSSFVPPGVRIENNTIYDNVTNIDKPGQSDQSARSQFQGQAIYIIQVHNNPGAGDQIIGNTLIGSPQGFVISYDQNTVISGNDISMNATYANDFCAALPADNQIVENNNCHPLSGRGFHINANNITVSNNTINVTELSQNAEYGGCEGGGAYGVQLEFDGSGSPTPPVNAKITGNTITARAGDCQADGLRVTNMTAAGSGTFSANKVTTMNNGKAGVDFGISIDHNDGTGITYIGNTFQSEYSYADGEWDGYTNNTVGHNTWLGSPTYSFLALDGACDPASNAKNGICPVTFSFEDNISAKMACGNYSEANVNFDGKVQRCIGTTTRH